MSDGFYKLESGNLLYATQSVRCLEYTLLREEKDTYTYPIDGWYWFDSEEQAKIFFNIN